MPTPRLFAQFLELFSHMHGGKEKVPHATPHDGADDDQREQQDRGQGGTGYRERRGGAIRRGDAREDRREEEERDEDDRQGRGEKPRTGRDDDLRIRQEDPEDEAGQEREEEE